MPKIIKNGIEYAGSLDSGGLTNLLWQQTVASGASQDFRNLNIDVSAYSRLLVEVTIVDSIQEIKNTSIIFYRGKWNANKTNRTYRLMGDYSGNYTMYFNVTNDTTLVTVSVSNSSTAGSAYTFYFSIYGL